MNTTNGGLHFEVGMDNSQMYKSAIDTEKILERIGKVAEEQAKQIKENFDKAAESMGLKKELPDLIDKDSVEMQKERLKELEKQYKALQKQIDSIAPGKAKETLKAEAFKIKSEIEREKVALKGLEEVVKENQVEHEALRSKLNAVRNEMYALAAAGQKGSEEYKKLEKDAIRYRESIDAVDKTLKAIKGNNILVAFVDGLNAVSGVASTTQGVMALLTGENENLNKIMVKLQATMSVAIGIQQMKNALDSQGSVIQKIQALQIGWKARAEDLATKKTIAATVAQKAYNLVASVNPYVLLVGAILSIVGALVVFSKRTNEAKERQEAFNKSVIDGVAEQMVKYKQLQAEWESLKGNAKGQEEWIKKNSNAFSDMGKEIRNVNDAENIFKIGSTAMVDAIYARAKSMAALQQATEIYKQYLEADNEASQFEKVSSQSTANQHWALTLVNDWRAGSKRREADEKKKAFEDFMALQRKEAEKAQNALNNIPTASDTKGWKENLEAQIEDIDKAINSAKTKSEVQRLEAKKAKLTAELNSVSTKPEKQKKDKLQLAEALPLESIAELERRLSLWENALKRIRKAQDGSQYVKERKQDKHGKEYETNRHISVEKALEERNRIAEQLEEKRKVLQRRSFDEEISELERQWHMRYQLAERYGEEVATLQFPNLSSSYLADLEGKFQLLGKKKEKGIRLSDSELEQWEILKTKMDQLNGTKDPFTNWKEDLERSLSVMTTATERLEYLKKVSESLTDDQKSQGYLVEVTQQNEAIVRDAEKAHQDILERYQSFQNEKIKIAERTAEAIKGIENDPNLTVEQKERYKTKITQQSERDISASAFEELTNSPTWTMLYENIDMLTAHQIDKLLEELEAKAPELTEAMTPTDFNRVVRAFREARRHLAEENPFRGFAKTFNQALASVPADVKDKMGYVKANFEEVRHSTERVFKSIRGAVEDIQPVKEILGETGAVALDTIETIAFSTISILEGVKTMSVAAVASIEATERASVILAIISSALRIITAIFNVFSKISDGKKERNIQAIKTQVDRLKEAYKELNHEIKKAVGTEYYNKQKEQINNLKEQEILLRKIADEEENKKKGDRNKAKEMREQANELKRQQEDLIEDFKKNIAQIDFRSLSDKLADALTDAFMQGEDAGKAFDKTMDNVFRNAVKNALKLKLIEPTVKDIVNDLTNKMGYGTDQQKDYNEIREALINKKADIETQLKDWQERDYSFFSGNGRDNFEKEREVMVAKLKKALATQEQQIKDLDSKSKNENSFDGLTKEEREAIKEKGRKAMEDYTNALKQYEDLFEMAAVNADSLKGGIKGMSEETGSIVAGQMNAIRQNTGDIRQNQLQSLEVARNTLSELSKIEHNTRTLHKIEKNIAEMNQKMKSDSLRAKGL